MKISKVILACVLCGVVGNVFAERNNITCVVKDINGDQVEFNFFIEDDSPNKIGRYLSSKNTVAYYEADIGAEIIKFDFGGDSESEINRRTGFIKLRGRYNNPAITDYGECEKSEDVVKKF